MESQRLFNGFVAEVYRRTGVTVDESKKSMLSSRVGRRVRALGLGDSKEYLTLLQGLDAAAGEVREFIDVVTTHKTSFFRTSGVWEWLENNLAEEPDRWRSFDAWSCACSSGQEAYSLAMVAHRAASRRSSLPWSIMATDVSQIAVDRAKRGIYPASEIEAIECSGSKVDTATYFDQRANGDHAVAAGLKAKVRFDQHNLIQRRSDKYDVAVLRNVLIYFTEEDKEKVVQNVLATLRPGGLLVIGESESLLRRGDGLEYLAPCIYRLTN